MVYNSNPGLAPSRRLAAAREDLFTVVSEQFVTDTADYATSCCRPRPLEQDDIMFSWGHLYVTYNQRAIDPLGEAVQHRAVPPLHGPTRPSHHLRPTEATDVRAGASDLRPRPARTAAARSSWSASMAARNFVAPVFRRAGRRATSTSCHLPAACAARS